MRSVSVSYGVYSNTLLLPPLGVLDVNIDV